MLKLKDFFIVFIVMLMLFLASCGNDDSVNNTNNNDTTDKDTIPTIFSITPDVMYSKTIFSIKGKNFGEEKPDVFYTEENTAEVLSWNDTLLTARFDTTPGTYNIFVKTTKGLKSNSKSIVVEAEPVEPTLEITSIEPLSGYRGDTITIKGTCFGITRELNTVTFGEIIVPNYNYVSWSDTLIKCIIPNSAVFGICDVFITTPSAISNKVSFNILVTNVIPKILGVAPTDEIGIGEQVTILGEDFGDTQLDNFYVLINDIKIVNVISWSNTMIKLLVPEGAVTGKIQVVSNGNPSNKFDIKIKKPQETGNPIIESLSNNEIAVNSGVQILGKNFGNSVGQVYLEGGLQLSNDEILNWKNESIRITVPPKGVKTGKLYIITADGKKSNEFNYSLKVNDRLKMILIKAGTFKMGNNLSTEPSEKPEHNVTITRDYYVSETEITQRQYKWQITLNTFVPKDVDDSPANNITFIDACQYCNLLSKEAGLDTCYIIKGSEITWIDSSNGYRLLTDAEWEYAAKAGTNSLWGFNTGTLKQYAWTASNAGVATFPFIVKQKDPNPWGLYDMLGNVEEWVWDYYDWDYYSNPDNSIDPKGPKSGVNRISRGGNFETSDDYCKTTTKNNFNQTQRKYSLGFRIARTK